MFSFSIAAEKARLRHCRRLLLACCLILSAFAGSGAAAESALSLAEATALAVDRAPLIEARDAGISSTSEEVARAASLPDPMLSFGVDSLPIGGTDAFSLTDDPMTMRSIGLTQALPSRAKREARRESALALQSQAVASKRASEIEIKRAAARAWIALWSAERERDLLNELREQNRLAVAAAKARLSGAAGTAGDALAARAAELELDNRIDDADAAIEQARAGLARWILEDARRPAATAPDFSVLLQSQSDLIARLDQQAPMLLWDAREAAADAALAEANAEKRPDWSIGGGVARRGAGASNVIWLQVGLGLPVFPANRQDRGIHARRADLQAIRAAREDARRAQEESLRRTFAEWSAQGSKVARFDESILPLGHDRSAITLAAFSGGAGLAAWLDAQRDEIRARIEYARLLGEWGQSWADLTFLLAQETAQ